MLFDPDCGPKVPMILAFVKLVNKVAQPFANVVALRSVRQVMHGNGRVQA